jgi:hypothetical protein
MERWNATMRADTKGPEKMHPIDETATDGNDTPLENWGFTTIIHGWASVSHRTIASRRKANRDTRICCISELLYYDCGSTTI